MDQVVERLWELQNVLSQLAEKEKSLNTQPESFAVVDREYQTANEEMARFKARIEDLAKERRKIELELQAAQDALKKYQAQLMQVKNQQQYAAAWKEIDTARKKVKELEDELLKRMTETEEAQAEVDKREAAHAELQARHDSEYQIWQSSLGELRSEIEKVKANASRIEETVPEPVKYEFHKIFRQRQGVAVAKVNNDSCGVCRVRVRPQAGQQLRRGELVICEGCRRIMYLEKPAS